MRQWLCGHTNKENKESAEDTSLLMEIVSPYRLRSGRRLLPSLSKSPKTVMATSQSCEIQVSLARAITHTYLALCERGFLNWTVGLKNCRLVDRHFFDPYNALALACAFVDLIVHSCSEQYKDTYFKTNAGKFCIVSIFTLCVKFAKGNAMRYGGDGYSCRHTTSVVYNFMFGSYRALAGVQRTLPELLFETEVYLLTNMGGRLHSLSNSCTSSKIEEKLGSAIEKALDGERTVLLMARNIAVVYALSMHCIDPSSDASLAIAHNAGIHTDILGDVALLVATQSLDAGQIGMPQCLLPFLKEERQLILTMAVQVLTYCRDNPSCVPLIQQAKRDVHCGALFEAGVQLKAATELTTKL